MQILHSLNVNELLDCITYDGFEKYICALFYLRLYESALIIEVLCEVLYGAYTIDLIYAL